MYENRFETFDRVLSRARKLRSVPAYKDVYIRKSMTQDERKKEKELRAKARGILRLCQPRRCLCQISLNISLAPFLDAAKGKRYSPQQVP
ncbi:hypothetical protein OSTOST_06194 [Ostertagia ostertagi]